VHALSSRVAAAAVLVLASAALLPVAAHQLGPTVSFLPGMLAVVACFDLMSVYLLVGEYRDTGDRRILAMSWCYVWSLVLMGGYSLAFPGAISPDPPLDLTPSMAPWFYIAWHGGFPALLGLAWAPWPVSWSVPTPVAVRRRAAWISTGLISGIAVSVVVLMSLLAGRLPVVIRGLDTSRMTELTAPVTIPLTLAALVLVLRGTRARTGPERWTSIVVLVCLCDLVLTYAARHRFSVGWYAGRTLTMVAAGVVLVAMLAVLRRAKSQAEHDAMVDSLTGLANRRSAQRDLSLLVDVARLTRTPLSAITLDIDHFKAVNDRFGHAAGDDLLAGLGRELNGLLRQTDVAARVGGEEFLVLLPNTDLAGAELIAEKIRAGVAAVRWPGLAAPVTVSLGVACLLGDTDDDAALLRRADVALYEAKNGGRNQVRVACQTAPRPRMPSGAVDRRVGLRTSP
jgi:diguanylate cyclase (GGDEF)-like protein